MEVTISKGVIDEDIGSSVPLKISPPGYKELKDLGKDVEKGHLCAKTLGGSGEIKSNVVTLYQQANSRMYHEVEKPIKKAVQQGETIVYKVKPIYDGDNLVPTKIQTEAVGDKGFHLDLVIDNVP